MKTLFSYINSVINPNSITDFVTLGITVAVVGYIIFHISQKSVPGIAGMVLPAAGGAILGAMLYIFAKGTS